MFLKEILKPTRKIGCSYLKKYAHTYMHQYGVIMALKILGMDKYIPLTVQSAFVIADLMCDDFPTWAVTNPRAHFPIPLENNVEDTCLYKEIIDNRIRISKVISTYNLRTKDFTNTCELFDTGIASKAYADVGAKACAYIIDLIGKSTHGLMDLCTHRGPHCNVNSLGFVGHPPFVGKGFNPDNAVVDEKNPYPPSNFFNYGGRRIDVRYDNGVFMIADFFMNILSDLHVSQKNIIEMAENLMIMRELMWSYEGAVDLDLMDIYLNDMKINYNGRDMSNDVLFDNIEQNYMTDLKRSKISRRIKGVSGGASAKIIVRTNSPKK